MKKIILLVLLCSCALVPCISFAQNDSQNEHRLFYDANSLYEKREYEKAAEEYTKILEAGIESGPLYYNVGNTLFKMGKTGYAILAYKKAQRIMPGDSDLKSNLAYAQSLTEDSGLWPAPVNRLKWLMKVPFREFSLNAVAIILMTLYLILVILLILGMINFTFRRHATFFFYLFLILFLAALTSFSVRYYDEEVIKQGIVVVKEAECKYEPIDKSTTYFTLKEGQEVQVLKTRSGWRRIRRLDGKLAWVKADAVEEID